MSVATSRSTISRRKKRLQHPLAQALCATALRVFWNPVGMGVGEDTTLGFIAALLYDDERGREDLARMDKLMAKLPGLGWFNRVSLEVGKAIEMFRAREPERAQQIYEKKQLVARERAMMPEDPTSRADASLRVIAGPRRKRIDAAADFLARRLPLLNCRCPDRPALLSSPERPLAPAPPARLVVRDLQKWRGSPPLPSKTNR